MNTPNISGNFVSDQFFAMLEKQGISINEQQSSAIKNKIDNLLSYEPKIGVFGKTGAGKSSLCNAVFGQDVCPISDVEACTRNPQEVIVKIGNKRGIKLIDVPGMGENAERDSEYALLYNNLLPELDLVLWVIKADDRAFTIDEKTYKSLVSPYIENGLPFFIILNQVDKVEPYREWDSDVRQPGPKQADNIFKKREVVSGNFNLPLQKIIPVSANERYGLLELVDSIIHALPKEKRLQVLLGVKDENRSENARYEASQGFFDSVVDFVKEKIPEIATAVADAVGKLITKSVTKSVGKLFSFFGL